MREEFGAESDVAAFRQGGNFDRTVEADPQFTAATSANYTVATGSPMIDGGDYLTVARNSGSGRQIPVADASWFYDGFGIAGDRGDLIQFQGQAATARITRIDYPANTLIVDRDLAWQGGEGISLAYTGNGPDIGAFER